MMQNRKNLLNNGKPLPNPEPIILRAGPLSLQYVDATLRYIRLGDIELLRQIYSAVRDQNWGTVLGTLINVSVQSGTDNFAIQFESIHQRSEIDFRWKGQITGDTQGTIRFHMAGAAHSQFTRNRIGFCILHPMDCAGLPCHVEQVDGAVIQSQFPEMIEPHQPFKGIRAVQHEYRTGAWVEVRMEGDTFEMEDQRNWIDASYKTYCTPLDLPFPVTIEPGTRIEQTITLRLLQAEAGAVVESDDSLTLSVQVGKAVAIPAIGLVASSHQEGLSEQGCARLGKLHLAHLRVDVHLNESNWQEHFSTQLSEAERIGVPLEAALHLGEDAEAQLQAFARLIEQWGVHVSRYLIFRDGEKSTRAERITLARRILGEAVPIVGGTDAFFTELNRERPEHAIMDGVVYSINPQVHAFDDASLVETLAVQAATVRSARAFSGRKPLHVGPITFKMRWNPNATAPQPPPRPGELPHQADPRQMSLFGAGWTLNSIKYLALGGATTLTYYETSGYMGVMATEHGSAVPDIFWNIAGGVYPMYHVFADIGEFRGGEIASLSSSDPLRVDGLGLQHGRRACYLLANLTPQPQDVQLALEGTFTLRILDAENAEFAMRDPEAYRTQPSTTIESSGSSISLQLAPFTFIRLDMNPS